MYVRNIFLIMGFGLGVVAMPATATVIDLTYNSWSNAVVSNGQTVSWTFDYSGYGINSDTVINSAALSIMAQGVDANADPVRIDSNLFLRNLTPGSGSTQFNLLGLSGTYDYLLDGMLTVSVTANEVRQYSGRHTYRDTHYYRQRHAYKVHHDFLWHHHDDTHYRYDTHSYNGYHARYDTHTTAGSLKLMSSNLNIVLQDPETVKVPEPATLALMSLGLLGVVGFKSRASRS